MSATAERKLTTIFCADVAGYSAMMDRDEDGTLATLKDYRGRMSAFIQRYRGRVVNTAGDGLMAEFASPVESVRCATDVQRELGASNAGRPPDRQMRFRIGINLGDVMVDDGDLFGEGVNIAARLQTLAQPGGILIAATVYDQVKSKLSVKFDFLGEQRVKNITEGIPTYRVLIDPPVRPAGATDAQWQDFAPADDEEEALASPAFDAGATFGADEASSPHAGEAPHTHRVVSGAQHLLGRVVGYTDNEEARSIARKSGLLGLVLGAIGVVTPLDFLVWPGMMIAFAGAQVAISKAGWGRRQSLRARMIALIALLFAINLASSFGQWWFVYPSAVLGLIALMSGDGPRGWGRRKPSG